MLRELPCGDRTSGNSSELRPIFRILAVRRSLALGLLYAKSMTKIAAGLQRMIENEFWKSSTFWLTVAAIVLPFGWLLFALKLEPVRVRARYFRCSF